MARGSAVAKVRTRSLSDDIPVRPRLRLVWSAENADPPSELQRGGPEHLVAYRHGYMLATAGQAERALVEFRSAIQKKPDFAEACYGVGCTLLELGQEQAAIGAWREAVAIKPDFVEALYNLGSTLMRLGDDKTLSEAITYLQTATQIRRDLTDGYINLGMALRWNNQPAEAAVALRTALTLKPNDIGARYLLGIALVFARQFPEAVAELSRTIDVMADNPVAHHMLGVALYETGKPEASIIEYQKTIGIEQDYPDIYLNIGASLSALKRYSDAAAAYRKAIEDNPDIAARQQMEAYIEWVDRNEKSVTIEITPDILIDLDMSEARRLYAEACKLGFTATSAIEALQAAAEAARETAGRAKPAAVPPAAETHQQTAPAQQEESAPSYWSGALRSVFGTQNPKAKPTESSDGRLSTEQVAARLKTKTRTYSTDDVTDDELNDPQAVEEARQIANANRRTRIETLKPEEAAVLRRARKITRIISDRRVKQAFQP